jgi:hypothetical protein
MTLDWRIQAAATTATEIPAAYPGGPSHPAGSTLVLSSQITPAEGVPILFPTPSAAALSLSIAARAARSAVELRTFLQFSPAIGPGGTVQNLNSSLTSKLFDYFENCSVAVLFSIQALEAYCNYKIAYTLNGEFAIERDGKQIMLSPLKVERELSIDEKLGEVLPSLLSVPTPKGRAVWEEYIHFRRLRDATVHIKSHHQWTSSSRDFEDSPYAWFLQHSASTIPMPAIAMLRYFALEHEHEWLNGAQKLMDGNVQ